VVFKKGILGGARQFWDNPYLNSTTVLFDKAKIIGMELKHQMVHQVVTFSLLCIK